MLQQELWTSLKQMKKIENLSKETEDIKKNQMKVL